MALQKQPDGSYITIPDSNTRPLPPEMFKSITVNDIAQDPVASKQYLSSSAAQLSPLPRQSGFQTASGPAPSGASGATPSSDPVTTFNLAILDMLKTAQSGAGNVDLFKQQRALQRTAIDRTAKMTPKDLRVLSPGQQSAIRSGSVQALEPEIDAVAAEIKARDSRLAHFESTLGQMREIGLDIAKNISPPKEVIEGYKNMLRMGGDISSIPVEIRNKVLAGLTPEDWTTFEQSQTDKGLVLDLIQKYPDAGIQPTDTLQAAQSKISKSKIYQDSVRAPQGPGSTVSERLLTSQQRILDDARTALNQQAATSQDTKANPDTYRDYLSKYIAAGGSQNDFFGALDLERYISTPNRKGVLSGSTTSYNQVTSSNNQTRLNELLAKSNNGQDLSKLSFAELAELQNLLK